jgi:hypothetical protein
LSDPSQPNPAAELARAVSLAHAPRPLAAAEHRAILERALGAKVRGETPAAKRRSATVVRVSFGVGAALALAASVALVVGSSTEREASAPTASLVASPSKAPFRARSTQPLFDEPFEPPRVAAAAGGPTTVAMRSRSSGSARIDRIATARASDFRENEFSRWGAR